MQTNEEIINIYNTYYKNGVSTCKLAEMFGHGHHYYLDKFKKLGLEIRSNKINSKRYTANYSYFHDIDTHEKAYWLGFIYADGYISSSDGRKRFGIAISKDDMEHLNTLNKCMDSNYKISTYKVTSGYNENSIYSRIIIFNETLYDDLVSHGVLEHKSNILKRPEIDEEFIPSFILGYIDGDGSIFHTRGSYSISIVGTDDVLIFIHEFLKTKGVVSKDLKLEKRRPNQIVSYIRYGGNKQVEQILDLLYKDIDKTIPLKRKMELYINCKNRVF